MLVVISTGICRKQNTFLFNVVKGSLQPTQRSHGEFDCTRGSFDVIDDAKEENIEEMPLLGGEEVVLF